MTPIKRAIAALDLTDTDQSILHFSRLAKDLFKISKLYFIHIIPNLVAPKNKDLYFHTKFATDVPVDETVKGRLEKVIEPYFKKSERDQFSIEVIEGKPYQMLAHWAEVKGADLLIFGKKKKSSGSGITARRAARNVPINLLMVPDSAPTTIKRILVPMDFSENSVRALQQAFNIKRTFPGSGIKVVHLIQTLTADHYYGLSQVAGYREQALRAARQAYAEMLRKNEIREEEAPVVFLNGEYGNVVRHLWEYTQDENPDLVVMGAQGHSAIHHFLYGSVTEDFVDYCDGVPILVVR